jgi:transposase
MTQITTVAIDLAKRVFQLHGTDEQGHAVLRRQVRRGQLPAVLGQLPRCTVVMEACSSAHHWGRVAASLGHRVRLIAPQHVKAFNRRQKNDRNDAEAIACAARQPQLPSVALKSQEQQAVLALHAIRERLIREQVGLVNQLHGLLGEFGLVLPRARQSFKRAVLDIVDGGQVPQLLHRALCEQLEHLRDLEARLAAITGQLQQSAKHSEPCRRLMRHRGVGPIIATAFVAELGDAGAFHNGRQVAAWLGLVPRQHSSGSRIRLLGITKRGNSYLRKQLIHGARAALRCAGRCADPVSRWALGLQQRRGWNRACVALANKTARRLWATLRYEVAVS